MSDNEDIKYEIELERQKAEAELKELTKEDKVIKDDSKTEEVSQTPSESEVKEERQFTEVELEQMEKGWDPNHKGPNAVSAEEFKRVGEIMEAKRKASKEAQLKSKEVEELTKTVRQLVEQQRKAEQVIKERTLKELYLKKMEKIQEGDVDGVLAVEREMDSQKTVVPETTKQIIDTPAIIEFKEKNKDWLTGTSQIDLAMQAYVKLRVEKIMQETPDISDELGLISIQEGLKEAFPQKFAPKEKPVMTGKSTISSTPVKSYNTSRLNADMRLEYAQIKRADPTYTVEEYIKQLELVGRLDK